MSEYPWREGTATGQPQAPEMPTGQRLEETARQARERARSLSETLTRGFEQARMLAAQGLTRAADTLRSSSGEPTSTARRFAEDLDRSASYLRQTNMDRVGHDVEGLIKQHPAQAVGAAFVVGWLLGRRLGRH